MSMNRPAFTILILLICLMTLFSFGCKFFPENSGPDTSGPETPSVDTGKLQGEIARRISDISEATSAEQIEEAVEKVIINGRSLGLLDENGSQLNPNVAGGAISLTPDDVASLASFVEAGPYRTVGSVVDYLAEAGVVLVSTSEVITFIDLLPDLQQYVDWSFANDNDPDSELGLLLASGADLKIPDSAPIISPTTRISPMAAILMLGDILIGVETENAETHAGNLFIKAAYADDVQETAKRIQGLITRVESFLKPVESTMNFFMKAGEKLGFTEPGNEPPRKIEIPQIAKQLIGAFAAGNHFAVRAETFSGATPEGLPVVKSIELNHVGDSEELLLSVEMVGYQGGNEKRYFIGNIPVLYTLRLLSPGETGTGAALYPDADAVLSTENPITKSEANGHIMDIAGKGAEILATVNVDATRLDNKEPRTAILYASATILTGDLGKEYEKYTKQYAGVISSLGLKPEEIQDMFKVMKTAVTVSPWMIEVILTGGRQVTIEPAELNGVPDQPYKFTAKIDDIPAGSHWEWSVGKKLGPGMVEDVKFNQGPDNIITLSFPDGGDYVVDVTLLDSDLSSANAIGSAQAKVVIEGEEEEKINIELSIEPEVIKGETGCQINFKLVPNVPWEKLPEKVFWQWDFDDDTGLFEREASPRTGIYHNDIYHNYTWPGSYDVKVKMLDGETRNVLAEAKAVADIDNLSAIQRTTRARALFWAYKKVTTYEDLNGKLTKRNDFQSYTSVGLSMSGALESLEWNGNQFHVSWTTSAGTQSYIYTVDGRISSDAREVEEIKVTSEFKDTDYHGKLWTYKEALVLNNIPVEKRNCGDSARFYCHWDGEISPGDPLSGHVHYEYESRIVGDYGDKGDSFKRFEGFDYSYTEELPAVEIEFWIDQ